MRSGTKYLGRTWPWWCCLRCWLQTGTLPPPSWAAAGSPQCGKIWHTLPHRSATLSVPHNDLPHQVPRPQFLRRRTLHKYDSLTAGDKSLKVLRGNYRVYYVPQTSRYIPQRNVCLAPHHRQANTAGAELGRVVLPSCRRAGPSSERIVTLHVLEQVPLSTRSNVPRRPRPDFASVNAPIGFVGTVLLIPVVWSHNQFEKKDSCCAIM